MDGERDAGDRASGRAGRDLALADRPERALALARARGRARALGGRDGRDRRASPIRARASSSASTRTSCCASAGGRVEDEDAATTVEFELGDDPDGHARARDRDRRACPPRRPAAPRALASRDDRSRPRLRRAGGRHAPHGVRARGRRAVRRPRASSRATCPVTRQAVAKHLSLLASAGLVESERVGRETRFHARGEPLREAIDWMAGVGARWDDRLALRLARAGWKLARDVRRTLRTDAVHARLGAVLGRGLVACELRSSRASRTGRRHPPAAGHHALPRAAYSDFFGIIPAGARLPARRRGGSGCGPPSPPPPCAPRPRARRARRGSARDRAGSGPGRPSTRPQALHSSAMPSASEARMRPPTTAGATPLPEKPTP